MAEILRKAKIIEDKRSAIIDKAVAAGFSIAIVPALLDLLIAEIVEAPEVIQDRHLINGPLLMDTVTLDVSYNGCPVKMTPLRLRLIEYFLRRLDRVIPLREIKKEVWGYAHENDVQYLRIYIAEIRELTSRDLIASVRGIGYIMRRAA